jgi:hypothetical protein
MRDVTPGDFSLFVLGDIHCGLILVVLVVDGRRATTLGQRLNHDG